MDWKSKPVGITKEVVPFGKRIDGSTVGIPIVTARGRADGPTIMVVGGVHGNEQEGMHAILSCIRHLDTSKMRGTLVAIPVLNVGAFEHKQRGFPLDYWYYDLNRVFPGKKRGSYTEALADKVLTEWVPGVDAIVSIHSGGNNSQACKRSIVPIHSEENLRLAKAMGPGWEVIAIGIGDRADVGTLTDVAAKEYGIPAITPELGGAGWRLPDAYNENVDELEKSIVNILREYGIVDGKPSYPKELWLSTYEPIRAESAGLIWLKPACRLMQEVKAGTELMEITDYLGNILEVVVAPYDGFMVLIHGTPSLCVGKTQVGSIGRLLKKIPVT
jgi:predicted deacylase